MHRGLEEKDDKCLLCVSYVKSKSSKKSINWNVSKASETTDLYTGIMPM
jgi:hypothetical protein